MSRLRNLVIISLLLVLTKNVSSVRKNPVLLISLDGFRADKLDQFLNENPNSNLKSIADKGVRAEFMKPSFPSSTFPNHWTLVTGEKKSPLQKILNFLSKIVCLLTRLVS